MAQPRLHIDFETISTVDLRRAGAHTYAEHPGTRVIILGYAFDDGPPDIWVPGINFPESVADHVAKGGEVHAWNANFELAVWSHTLRRQCSFLAPLHPEQCHCTMAAAAYWGLPLALEQAASALKLPQGKDRVGHALMLRMSRPRSFTQDGEPVWWHDQDASRYRALQDYCRQDIEVERRIFHAIPPLPPREREVWLVDHRMNARGIKVDLPLVDALDKLTRQETKRLDADMREITGGEANTRTVGSLTRWLQNRGVIVDSLDKAHMGDLLDDARLPSDVIQALLIRQEAAKTSTAKLKTMKTAAGTDGRVRGSVQYYGAIRTGRWAGRLTQIQNYPRIPKMFPVKQAIESVLLGDDPETLNLQFGSVLGLISVLLRPCFVADTGKVLVSADFSQVEARVVAWLAGQTDILEVFARGEDVYTYAAQKIGSQNRQLGKVITLALGFGMGAAKFVSTAALSAITLDFDEAHRIVQDWRAVNRNIVRLWYDCEGAAKEVLETNLQLRWKNVGKLGFRMARDDSALKGALLMRLPSGRYLVYRDARLDDGSITYAGVNQYNRAWEDIRTYGGKLVENAVQATARDLMADLMVRVERTRPGTLVASVHDEAVMEVPEALGHPVLTEVLEMLKAGPQWSDGLPVSGEGYVATQYVKS